MTVSQGNDGFACRLKKAFAAHLTHMSLVTLMSRMKIRTRPSTFWKIPKRNVQKCATDDKKTATQNNCKKSYSLYYHSSE